MKYRQTTVTKRRWNGDGEDEEEEEEEEDWLNIFISSLLTNRMIIVINKTYFR